MTPDLQLAVETFERARQYVVSAGLQSEVDWQRSRNFSCFTESDLLREAAWVILCSGFREAVVRRIFDHVSLSFCDWELAELIVLSARACRATAVAAMRNVSKLDAIITVAQSVYALGFGSLRDRILCDPITELRRFPFIGPVTVWHLAKNLGLEVAKPDRHLVRLCRVLGFESANDLCTSIARSCGEPVHVVDIVLWRYLADGLVVSS